MFRLDSDLVAKLEEAAKKYNMSKTEIVEDALAEYLGTDDAHSETGAASGAVEIELSASSMKAIEAIKRELFYVDVNVQANREALNTILTRLGISEMVRSENGAMGEIDKFVEARVRTNKQKRDEKNSVL
jgi:metal-responsive CopG/Arc/MetJ family transcriptional regulator